MKREYALIAALLATTAAIAVVSRGDNTSPDRNEPPAPTAAAPASVPAPAPAPASPPTVVAEVAPSAPEASPSSEAPPAPEADTLEVAGLEETLREREAERDRLQLRLEEGEQTLTERDARIRDIEAQLVARSAEVRVLEAEIKVLRARSTYQAELAALRAGRAPSPAEAPAAQLPSAAPDGLDAALADAKGPATESDQPMPAAAAAPAPEPQIFAEIHFEMASAALTPGGQERVRAVAAALEDMPLAGIEVLGYTDTTGGRDANRRLATRRADSVAVALVEAGLDTSLIAATGRGEEGAPVLTEQGVAEPLNRSVEIVARP